MKENAIYQGDVTAVFVDELIRIQFNSQMNLNNFYYFDIFYFNSFLNEKYKTVCTSSSSSKVIKFKLI